MDASNMSASHISATAMDPNTNDDVSNYTHSSSKYMKSIVPTKEMTDPTDSKTDTHNMATFPE